MILREIYELRKEIATEELARKIGWEEWVSLPAESAEDASVNAEEQKQAQISEKAAQVLHLNERNAGSVSLSPGRGRMVR